MIGYGPAYHFVELAKHPEDAATWDKASRHEPVDWVKFLEGWDSSVDWPGCHFYREMMEAWPDAKVLLSVRDPENWYQSYYDTIWLVTQELAAGREPPAYVKPVLDLAARNMTHDTFDGQFENKEKTIAVFNRHIEQVKRTVPASKLLVFDVKEGWEPLCAFLGAPVPDQPFPHLNDTAGFRQFVITMMGGGVPVHS
jgi:hypothetical protein